MNLSDEIRLAILCALPKKSGLKPEDIKIMTNMILSAMRRNNFITNKDYYNMQIPMPDKSARAKYYERSWKMLSLIDVNKYRTIPEDNREE